jgi:phosphatidylglycerol:prolipoprotein diacylglycerol transferase
MVPYPDIDPVAIALGPLKIHWYGLTYIGGLAFAWWLARRRTAHAGAPLQRDQVDDLIFYAAIGIILGGRVGYAFFYGLDRLSADPLWLFRVWEGGMAFHGGLLGVLIAMGVFARQQGIQWGRLMDFVAPWLWGGWATSLARSSGAELARSPGPWSFPETHWGWRATPRSSISLL